MLAEAKKGIWNTINAFIRWILRNKVTVIVTLLVIIVYLALKEYIFKSPLIETQDFYSLIASSVIAMIGVSVTGYIFLIEYIRRLKTERPIYLTIAEKFKSRTYNSLFILFWFGVSIGLACIFLMSEFSERKDCPEWLIYILIALFIIFLASAVQIDVKMMHAENEISNYVKDNKKRALKKIQDDTDLIVRLNSNEYDEIIHSPEFVPGIPEVGYNGQYDIISFIHGGETEDMRVEYENKTIRNNTPIIGYRDNRDEYDVENVLNIFSDIEKLLCRLIGINGNFVPENVSISTMLAANSSQSNEIGMTNDVEWYYQRIREYRDYFLL